MQSTNILSEFITPNKVLLIAPHVCLNQWRPWTCNSVPKRLSDCDINWGHNSSWYCVIQGLFGKFNLTFRMSTLSHKRAAFIRSRGFLYPCLPLRLPKHLFAEIVITNAQQYSYGGGRLRVVILVWANAMLMSCPKGVLFCFAEQFRNSVMCKGGVFVVAIVFAHPSLPPCPWHNCYGQGWVDHQLLLLPLPDTTYYYVFR